MQRRLVSADVIFVMQNRRISERGTHRDLASREGVYAWLYRKGLVTAGED